MINSKDIAIAAASILAKTYRDDYMKALHSKFPQYNWVQNKGYATKEHQAALDKIVTSRVCVDYSGDTFNMACGHHRFYYYAVCRVIPYL